ncbi:hypothetical protein [Calycomorphotria hydatis]|uniref:Uncharacterized protein n=1 Tax=Calycomorphotria hydatis TaxID=2528027 RepID=A0A517TCK3_9PLAN|nr:hypothetical protein [Calycomorphotria hydatis]QDT66104.1 hypothetical protein V22_33680 [Calycomorphotria hydatis]
MSRKPLSREVLVRRVLDYADDPEAAFTVMDFARRQRTAPATILKYFPGGGWADLLAAAGLSHRQRFSHGAEGELLKRPGERQGAVDAIRRWSRGRLVAKLKEFAEQTEGSITAAKFRSWVPVSATTIAKYFPDGWEELKAEAGLPAGRAAAEKYTYTMQQILEGYGECRRHLGGNRPLMRHIRRYCAFSPQIVQNRFGSLAVLHLTWEKYEKTGEIPDPLPEPGEPSMECAEELYNLPPLGPLPTSLNTYDLMRYARGQ